MTEVQVVQAKGGNRTAEFIRFDARGQKALVKWPDTGRQVWIDKRRLRGLPEQKSQA